MAIFFPLDVSIHYLFRENIQQLMDIKNKLSFQRKERIR